MEVEFNAIEIAMSIESIMFFIMVYFIWDKILDKSYTTFQINLYNCKIASFPRWINLVEMTQMQML